MRDGRCPKCDAETVHAVTEPPAGGLLQTGWLSRVPITHYICVTCGYTESYVLDRGRLDEITRTWPEVRAAQPPYESVEHDTRRLR